jgi:hypothetical protein
MAAFSIPHTVVADIKREDGVFFWYKDDQKKCYY